jgi:hypothetical protein
LYRFGAWLMHLFMVQVDYRLMYGTGWHMVDALFMYRLLQVEVQVDAWFRLLVQVDWYRFTTIYLTVIV